MRGVAQNDVVVVDVPCHGILGGVAAAASDDAAEAECCCGKLSPPTTAAKKIYRYHSARSLASREVDTA